MIQLYTSIRTFLFNGHDIYSRGIYILLKREVTDLKLAPRVYLQISNFLALEVVSHNMPLVTYQLYTCFYGALMDSLMKEAFLQC